MSFLDILYNISKIESILYDVYNDECSYNEGSLTYRNLQDILFLSNQIRVIIIDNLERSKNE